MKTQIIDIKKIVPDENQPRKTFLADKMAILTASIKAKGILEPLRVEDNGNGTYRLVNGERRYRAAMQLKLKELPCIVEAPMDDMTRLITQFHIQDEHEDWTPAEKAQVVFKMSEDFKIPMKDVCRLLNIDPRLASKYVAFARLVDKENFQDNNLTIDYAEKMQGIKVSARKSFEKSLGKDLTRDDEKKIEATLVQMVKSGAVNKSSDLTKIKDSCVQDVKSVQDLISGKAVSANDMFKKSSANGARSLRNMLSSGRYFVMNANNLIKEDSIAPDQSQLRVVKEVKAMADKILNEYAE